MSDSRTKPTIGISACLLGENVRYDGAHKRSRWIVERLGKHVSFERVCPEYEMGLGVPREAMDLRRVDDRIHLFSKSGHKLTELAEESSQRLASSLPKSLGGFIFKSRSPSCGVGSTPVYGPKEVTSTEETGIFAKNVLSLFPLLAVIEETQLADPGLREHFLTRVFANHAVLGLAPKIADIQKFHESYKFLIQSHDEQSLRRLGQIAANSTRRRAAEVLSSYRYEFLRALSQPASRKKRVNVVQHVYGFVKEQMDLKEKERTLEEIECYRREEISFQKIASSLLRTAQRYKARYIEKQVLFSPFPRELAR